MGNATAWRQLSKRDRSDESVALQPHRLHRPTTGATAATWLRGRPGGAWICIHDERASECDHLLHFGCVGSAPLARRYLVQCGCVRRANSDKDERCHRRARPQSQPATKRRAAKLDPVVWTGKGELLGRALMRAGASTEEGA